MPQFLETKILGVRKKIDKLKNGITEKQKTIHTLKILVAHLNNQPNTSMIRVINHTNRKITQIANKIEDWEDNIESMNEILYHYITLRNNARISSFNDPSQQKSDQKRH